MLTSVEINLLLYIQKELALGACGILKFQDSVNDSMILYWKKIWNISLKW